MYALYIDDSILGAPTKGELEAAIKAIQDAKLQISLEGDLADFLGVKIERKGTNKIIFTLTRFTSKPRFSRYYSPAPRNIARSDWATQNITHNMTSSKT